MIIKINMCVVHLLVFNEASKCCNNLNSKHFNTFGGDFLLDVFFSL